MTRAKKIDTKARSNYVYLTKCKCQVLVIDTGKIVILARKHYQIDKAFVGQIIKLIIGVDAYAEFDKGKAPTFHRLVFNRLSVLTKVNWFDLNFILLKNTTKHHYQSKKKQTLKIWL